MSDPEIRALGAKFDINILEEASYVLWYLWRAIHPPYSTLQSCIAALTNDTKLYKALKSAHSTGNYDLVRYWGTSLTVHWHLLVNFWNLADSVTESSRHKDNTVESAVNIFLEEIRPATTRLVTGNISFSLWSPSPGSMDDEMAKHIEALHIPCLKGKPNVLLHDLGSFKNDPALARRLKNIFMPNNHTFVSSVVYASISDMLVAFLLIHLVQEKVDFSLKVFAITGVFISRPSSTLVC
jgi:hypothetical protein